MRLMILGIDEVGRGPWAGPLVVGAVVLSPDTTFEGLNDSKKLTASKRAALDTEIRSKALGYGLGWVHADELDRIGLSEALKVATIRAVEAVKVPYHEIIIDGTINFLKETTKGRYVTTLAKADALIPAVSAASVIAKVARDRFMEEQAALYPEYGFDAHVGYGTLRHKTAIDAHGVTPLHRISFAPIKKVLKGHDQEQRPKVPTSKSIGDSAEHKLEAWLVRNNFTIVARNWKTRYCEIDRIADKQHKRYFIEVKYRSSSKQGGGIAAITPKKLQQMRFAAALHASNHPYDGESCLAVASIDTEDRLTFIEV